MINSLTSFCATALPAHAMQVLRFLTFISRLHRICSTHNQPCRCAGPWHLPPTIEATLCTRQRHGNAISCCAVLSKVCFLQLFTRGTHQGLQWRTVPCLGFKPNLRLKLAGVAAICVQVLAASLRRCMQASR
jgi:hypothetical protein